MNSSSGAGLGVHAALLLVQVMFSGFHVVAKATLAHLHPLALAAARVLVAAPLMTGLAWYHDRRLPALRQLPLLALLGLLGVFANQLLFILGLQQTSATNAGILMPSIPAFAAAAAAALGMERISAGRVAGVALSVAGALVLLRPHRFSLEDGTVLGNLLVLANCASYSLFLVLQRPAHRRMPWRTVIAGAFVFGGAGVLAVGGPQLAAVRPAELPAAAWWGLAYIVLLPTTVGYMTNTWALRRSSSVLAAAYTTLQPLVTATLASLFLGEAFGWLELAGLTLIVSGLWQVSRT
jgi:drug/metabolite transporter (DMT)-like permease